MNKISGVITALNGRKEVGSKKSNALLNIVQKLTEKRKANEEEKKEAIIEKVSGIKTEKK